MQFFKKLQNNIVYMFTGIFSDFKSLYNVDAHVHSKLQLESMSQSM